MEQPAQAPAPGSAGAGFGKYCLGCVVLLLLIVGVPAGVGYHVLEGLLVEEPAEVSALLDEVLECSVPQDFSGRIGMSARGLKLAILTRSGAAITPQAPLILAVVGLPAGTGEQEAQQQVERILQLKLGLQITSEPWFVPRFNAGNYDCELALEGRAVLGERFTERVEQTALQKILLLIERNGGSEQVLVYAIGAEAGFDLGTLEAFVASIRGGWTVPSTSPSAPAPQVAPPGSPTFPPASGGK